MSQHSGKSHKDLGGAAFSGYHRNLVREPDLDLCQTGRNTPGGEYLRRFWHPICYVSELQDRPLRVRALGEDLVAFKTKLGDIGVLFLACCHRNSSLEFGIIEEQGLRCCYHGRLIGVNGRIAEFPGEPAADQMREQISQGAYPTHEFGGIVFIYMGPPDRIPVFPTYDRLTLPGLTLVPGVRLELDCNYIQLKENALDPAHTAVLHVIPQIRGMDHFANEFVTFPEIVWSETAGGLIYLAARRVDENIWVRSAETLGATIHCISSIFESGRAPKSATPPFLTFWTLPVDDSHSVNFFVSHVAENEQLPFEKRRELEIFGQCEDRPYAERQWIPGDHDAMVSQGPINIHGAEFLGSMDRGVVMFRRFIRRGIEAVREGKDPIGFYLEQAEVPPTFANDRVVLETEIAGNPLDPAGLRAFATAVAEDYKASPPMKSLG